MGGRGSDVGELPLIDIPEEHPIVFSDDVLLPTGIQGSENLSIFQVHGYTQERVDNCMKDKDKTVWELVSPDNRLRCDYRDRTVFGRFQFDKTHLDYVNDDHLFMLAKGNYTCTTSNPLEVGVEDINKPVEGTSVIDDQYTLYETHMQMQYFEEAIREVEKDEKLGKGRIKRVMVLFNDSFYKALERTIRGDCPDGTFITPPNVKDGHLELPKNDPNCSWRNEERFRIHRRCYELVCVQRIVDAVLESRKGVQGLGKLEVCFDFDIGCVAEDVAYIKRVVFREYDDKCKTTFRAKGQSFYDINCGQPLSDDTGQNDCLVVSLRSTGPLTQILADIDLNIAARNDPQNRPNPENTGDPGDPGNSQTPHTRTCVLAIICPPSGIAYDMDTTRTQDYLAEKFKVRTLVPRPSKRPKGKIIKSPEGVNGYLPALTLYRLCNEKYGLMIEDEQPNDSSAENSSDSDIAYVSEQ